MDIRNLAVTGNVGSFSEVLPQRQSPSSARCGGLCEGGIMIEKRRNSRIDCFAKCILYHNDAKYWAILENISFTGALVRICGTIPVGIRKGDKCSLILHNDPAFSAGQFNSKIARLNSSRIGLSFLDRDVGEP